MRLRRFGAVAGSLSAAATNLTLTSVAAAQTLGQGAEVQIPWWRLIAALLLCIGLAVGAAYALKTRFRGGLSVFKTESKRLELVEALRLSHQIDICLIKCDGRDLLVAATPQGLVELNMGAKAVAKAPPK